MHFASWVGDFVHVFQVLHQEAWLMNLPNLSHGKTMSFWKGYTLQI